jgi:hypothetical protein
VTVGQQAGAADGFPLIVDGEQLHGTGIVDVPFQRFGHALLVDEHRTPDVGQPCLLVRPVGEQNAEISHVRLAG